MYAISSLDFFVAAYKLIGLSTLKLVLNGVAWIFPYTLELLAYIKCLMLNFLTASSIFPNPTILFSIYVFGLSMLYLTPACAAKLQTIL